MRLTSRLGGKLAVPLLIFLVALGSAFGAFFVLPNPTPSAASDDRTPQGLMPLAQDDNLASWNPHVERLPRRGHRPGLDGQGLLRARRVAVRQRHARAVRVEREHVPGPPGLRVLGRRELETPCPDRRAPVDRPRALPGDLVPADGSEL